MPRVCFVTPGVLPMLRGREGTVYGGSELRAWRFARGLADLGFDVSIVGFDHEAVPADVLGPVSIVGPATSSGWFGGFRRILGKQAAAPQNAAWRAAEADIYVAFGAADYNADLAEWCLANNRPFLLIAGSDIDFSVDYRPDNPSRTSWGHRCDRCYDAIVKASSIVVQTGTQRRLLKENFGRDARIIANPIPIGEAADSSLPRKHILWIGKAVSNKRPDLALAVARACPSIPFRVIANKVDERSFRELLEDAPANVVILESVRPSELHNEFAGAIALLCTSELEGFPNTFLDAGCFGVPVLSLGIDPDGMITREGGGVVTNGDLAALTMAAQEYAGNPALARDAGKRLHNYVRLRHEATARFAELSAELRDVLANSVTRSHSMA